MIERGRGAAAVRCISRSVSRSFDAEGELAGEHLEEEDAERVEIALRRRLLAARLLGRHVLGRPEDRALGREARVHREVREAEVEDLHEVFPAAARA